MQAETYKKEKEQVRIKKEKKAKVKQIFLEEEVRNINLKPLMEEGQVNKRMKQSEKDFRRQVKKLRQIRTDIYEKEGSSKWTSWRPENNTNNNTNSNKAKLVKQMIKQAIYEVEQEDRGTVDSSTSSGSNSSSNSSNSSSNSKDYIRSDRDEKLIKQIEDNLLVKFKLMLDQNNEQLLKTITRNTILKRQRDRKRKRETERVLSYDNVYIINEITNHKSLLLLVRCF